DFGQRNLRVLMMTELHGRDARAPAGQRFDGEIEVDRAREQRFTACRRRAWNAAFRERTRATAPSALHRLLELPDRFGVELELLALRGPELTRKRRELSLHEVERAPAAPFLHRHAFTGIRHVRAAGREAVEDCLVRGLCRRDRRERATIAEEAG